MNINNESIILIGMPGAGKSTLGVILAKVIGYRFVDADLVIQQKEGKLLKDIIAGCGVEGFIELENRINADINDKRTVIATGGSAVYGKDAMANYKSLGRIVYLRLEYEELEKRLGDIKNRGVVFRENQSFEELYNERCALYERYADIVINETGLNIEQTLEKVIAELGKI